MTIVRQIGSLFRSRFLLLNFLAIQAFPKDIHLQLLEQRKFQHLDKVLPSLNIPTNAGDLELRNSNQQKKAIFQNVMVRFSPTYYGGHFITQFQHFSNKLKSGFSWTMENQGAVVKFDNCSSRINVKTLNSIMTDSFQVLNLENSVK